MKQMQIKTKNKCSVREISHKLNKFSFLNDRIYLTNTSYISVIYIYIYPKLILSTIHIFNLLMFSRPVPSHLRNPNQLPKSLKDLNTL